MQVNISSAPDYAMAEVDLAQNEQIVVESGSMVAMSSNLSIETKAKGGVLSGLKRMVGGESFFMNTYTSAGAPGKIMIAPGVPGDMRHIQLAGGDFYIQSKSYGASPPGVTP